MNEGQHSNDPTTIITIHELQGNQNEQTNYNNKFLSFVSIVVVVVLFAFCCYMIVVYNLIVADTATATATHRRRHVLLVACCFLSSNQIIIDNKIFLSIQRLHYLYTTRRWGNRLREELLIWI